MEILLLIGNWGLGRVGKFGGWRLEVGGWSLEFGVWNLEFGIWSLEFGEGRVGRFFQNNNITMFMIHQPLFMINLYPLRHPDQTFLHCHQLLHILISTTMVHRPWSIVHGLWSMVYGPSSIVHGPWSMVHGLTPPADTILPKLWHTFTHHL
mgnify:FL=1